MRAVNPSRRREPEPRSRRRQSALTESAEAAFTLVEMLVVLAIIGILLALSLPHFRHMNEGRAMEGATQQLMADLAYARQMAIANRGSTAVVFVPPDSDPFSTVPDTNDMAVIRDLEGGVFTTYAVIALRQAGEQPGRATARYLTDWRTLPQKTFIAEWKFTNELNGGFFTNRFPFPRTESRDVFLPYVAFDPQGRCIRLDDQKSILGTGEPAGDIHIPLARGAILYSRDPSGAVLDYTVNEIPPSNSITASNVIHIDWLTGRAKLERADVIKP